jgi:hypothetical protein
MVLDRGLEVHSLFLHRTYLIVVQQSQAGGVAAVVVVILLSCRRRPTNPINRQSGTVLEYLIAPETRRKKKAIKEQDKQ